MSYTFSDFMKSLNEDESLQESLKKALREAQEKRGELLDTWEPEGGTEEPTLNQCRTVVHIFEVLQSANGRIGDPTIKVQKTERYIEQWNGTEWIRIGRLAQ